MDIRETIRSHGDVALAITKHLLQHEAKASNVILSPLSIHVLLSLVAAGSKGPPLDQLLSFLKSNSTDNLNSFASQIVATVFADASPSGGPRLAFANGVWVDQSLSLKPSFQQVVDTVYKALLSQADFKTKAVEVISEVNSWAEKQTNGLITELLPPGSIDSLSKLILANALYFKGAWEEEFDASKTEKREFYLLDGKSVEVPFMSSKKKQYVAAFDGFKVLALPYKQGSDPRRFSMYIFLPDSKDGLPHLIEKLDSQSGFIDRHIPYEKVKVGEFKVPKFKFSFGIEVSNVLKGLGLVLPFTEGGLLEMVDSPLAQGLHVSKIFHKAFIEVNEEGTEAAAASAVVIAYRSMAFGDIIDFVANRPFLFLIREDKTGTLLFTGQVLNPLVH
ncbi:serpin-ZX-like [Cucurbita pepo subsp. pepo]|uniref:serpin-ZX-like n=1 Tax=Cucurbita pepo subsp. pepo TaxID=3664 RepID=UPI000C9D5CCF|nr:serpin-ZX-like [Cucurbita pepo subsp. pepo]